MTFAYNTAGQEITELTRFELVYGRRVTTPLDAMLPVEHDTSSNDSVDDFCQKAEEARQLARNRIRTQQDTDSRRYNVGRRNVHYQPGDYVWVWTPISHCGLSEKLLRRYLGPYEVVRCLSDVNYEVVPQSSDPSLSRRRPRAEVVHVVRMKPYHARE